MRVEGTKRGQNSCERNMTGLFLLLIGWEIGLFLVYPITKRSNAKSKENHSLLLVDAKAIFQD